MNALADADEDEDAVPAQRESLFRNLLCGSFLWLPALVLLAFQALPAKFVHSLFTFSAS